MLRDGVRSGAVAGVQSDHPLPIVPCRLPGRTTRAPTPALLNSECTWPHRSSAWRASSSTSLRFETSVFTASTLPPPFFSSVSAVARAASLMSARLHSYPREHTVRRSQSNAGCRTGNHCNFTCKLVHSVRRHPPDYSLGRLSRSARSLARPLAALFSRRRAKLITGTIISSI